MDQNYSPLLTDFSCFCIIVFWGKNISIPNINMEIIFNFKRDHMLQLKHKQYGQNVRSVQSYDKIPVYLTETQS